MTESENSECEVNISKQSQRPVIDEPSMPTTKPGIKKKRGSKREGERERDSEDVSVELFTGCVECCDSNRQAANVLKRDTKVPG